MGKYEYEYKYSDWYLQIQIQIQILSHTKYKKKYIYIMVIKSIKGCKLIYIITIIYKLYCLTLIIWKNTKI